MLLAERDALKASLVISQAQTPLIIRIMAITGPRGNTPNLSGIIMGEGACN